MVDGGHCSWCVSSSQRNPMPVCENTHKPPARAQSLRRWQATLPQPRLRSPGGACRQSQGHPRPLLPVSTLDGSMTSTSRQAKVAFPEHMHTSLGAGARARRHLSRVSSQMSPFLRPSCHSREECTPGVFRSTWDLGPRSATWLPALQVSTPPAGAWKTPLSPCLPMYEAAVVSTCHGGRRPAGGAGTRSPISGSSREFVVGSGLLSTLQRARRSSAVFSTLHLADVLRIASANRYKIFQASR